MRFQASYIAVNHLGHHFTGTVSGKTNREAMNLLIAKVRAEICITAISGFCFCVGTEMQRLTINEVSEIFFS